MRYLHTRLATGYLLAGFVNHFAGDICYYNLCGGVISILNHYISIAAGRVWHYCHVHITQGYVSYGCRPLGKANPVQVKIITTAVCTIHGCSITRLVTE